MVAPSVGQKRADLFLGHREGAAHRPGFVRPAAIYVHHVELVGLSLGRHLELHALGVVLDAFTLEPLCSLWLVALCDPRSHYLALSALYSLSRSLSLQPRLYVSAFRLSLSVTLTSQPISLSSDGSALLCDLAATSSHGIFIPPPLSSSSSTLLFPVSLSPLILFRPPQIVLQCLRHLL